MVVEDSRSKSENIWTKLAHHKQNDVFEVRPSHSYPQVHNPRPTDLCWGHLEANLHRPNFSFLRCPDIPLSCPKVTTNAHGFRA